MTMVALKLIDWRSKSSLFTNARDPKLLTRASGADDGFGTFLLVFEDEEW
jgi:hypothetical protein